MVKNKQLKEKVFYWLLAFVVISLPFPAYNLNSQAIILFSVFWVFYNPFSEKKELFLQNKIPILLISSLFWVPLIWVLFATNFSESLKELQLRLPFLVFPLTLLTVRLQPNTKTFVLNQFLIGVIFASMLALAKVVFFKINNLGNYFYYSKFSEFLDKHTTYFSLFVVISLLWILWLFLHKKGNKIILSMAFLVLLGVFYLLSVRISIIALLVGTLVLFISQLTSTKKKALIAIFIPIIFISIYFTPHFQKRFDPSTTETEQISDMEFRKLHWEAVLEAINQNNILVGTGTRGDKDFLYNRYKEYGLMSAYDEKYNAHNQYLETLLEFGLIGFIIFIVLIYYIAHLFIKTKNFFAFSIFLVFLIYMLTESILQRHSGIVLFSFLISLFAKHQIQRKLNT